MDYNWLFDNFTDFVFWKGVICGAVGGLFLSKYFWNFLTFLLKSVTDRIAAVRYRWRELCEHDDKKKRLAGIYWNPEGQLIDSSGKHYCPHCFSQGVRLELDKVKTISQFRHEQPIYH